MKTLSLVVPIFNEEELLDELFSRVLAVFDSMASKAKCELVLVNDGSRDRSIEIMRERAIKDSRVVVVDLSRNFGHQAAITAGLNVATGDAIAIMDGDLQDPPELLPEMFASWQAGHQVVIAKRRSRAENTIRKGVFNLFYKVLGSLSDFPIELNAGNFSLIDRRVLNVLLSLEERNRFLPGLRSWVGFKQGTVFYDRNDRAAGTPKMTYAKLLKYGFDAVFSFSYKPLRAIWTLGFTVSMLCIVYALYLIALRVLNVNVVPGFTTPTVAILFLGGVQLISVGMLGEYLGRIYDEVKRRPLFVISEVISQHNQKIAEEAYAVSDARN